MMKYLHVCAALAACASPEDEVELGVDGGGTANAPVLSGPVGEWTWFDIPGAVCGYGQQTGIGVSVGTGSEVMIYLEGGGLCWDEVTCAASIPPLPPVTNQTIVLASYFTSGFTR